MPALYTCAHKYRGNLLAALAPFRPTQVGLITQVCWCCQHHTQAYVQATPAATPAHSVPAFLHIQDWPFSCRTSHHTHAPKSCVRTEPTHLQRSLSSSARAGKSETCLAWDLRDRGQCMDKHKDHLRCNPGLRPWLLSQNSEHVKEANILSFVNDPCSFYSMIERSVCLHSHTHTT
jgi:hypothetical protein